MTFWRTFHRVNEDLVFPFGLGINLLLLIVIKNVKVQSMQKYNILLVQCCCIDLIQNIVSFIVKPVTVMHEKSLYYLSNGYLRSIGGSIEMAGIVLWSTSVFLCMCSMPLSYIFRYRILCLDAEITKKFYILSLSVAVFNVAIFGTILWKFHYLDNRDKTYLAEKNFAWLMADDEGKVKAASVCLAGSTGMLFTIIDALLLTFIPYSIIVICNFKILKRLKHHQQHLTAASRRVQMDLNRVLLAQAIIPIFSAFLPMSIHILSAITDFDFTFISFVSGIVYAWIPVGNGLTIFIFITAYREKLKQLLFFKKPHSPQLVPASTTVPTLS